MYFLMPVPLGAEAAALDADVLDVQKREDFMPSSEHYERPPAWNEAYAREVVEEYVTGLTNPDRPETAQSYAFLIWPVGQPDAALLVQVCPTLAWDIWAGSAGAVRGSLRRLDDWDDERGARW